MVRKPSIQIKGIGSSVEISSGGTSSILLTTQDNHRGSKRTAVLRLMIRDAPALIDAINEKVEDVRANGEDS